MGEKTGHKDDTPGFLPHPVVVLGEVDNGFTAVTGSQMWEQTVRAPLLVTSSSCGPVGPEPRLGLELLWCGGEADAAPSPPALEGLLGFFFLNLLPGPG